MDVTNPLRSLTPTVDSDVLAVLAHSHVALTGLRVQQLAGRSYGQVREVLRRLVAHGIVDAERHGASIAYSLNREHVLAPAIELAAAAVIDVERRLRESFQRWRPAAVAAVVFGSFARRDGGLESDIDLLIVRPEDITDDDMTWTAQRHELVRCLERWTGNTVQVVELTSTELDDAICRRDDLVHTLRRDGHVLIGPPLRALLAPK